MRSALLVIAVLVTTTACHTQKSIRATTPAPAKADVLSDSDGLRTMRMVLSDEIANGRSGFRNLPDVVRALPTAGATMTPDGTAAALKGYRLRLTVSEDKKHFQASLTPEAGCGTSWFGNEQSLIYVGRPLGCTTNQ